jgi:poly(3-hydroxybutyrate) depolymerase
MLNSCLDPCLDAARFVGTASCRCTPEFMSLNTVVYEDQAIILRRFDEGRTGIPILIAPPQAGHHSSIADYAEGQSLVQTCLKETTEPVYVIEWKPSTPYRYHETIDDLVLQVHTCVQVIGEPVILTGLCQGGWLSAIYACLYPENVRALALAAAPIDFTAGGGKVQDIVQKVPISFYQAMVALGMGIMPGDFMLTGWKLLNPYERFVRDFVNVWVNVRDTASLERTKRFQNWYEYTQNISGIWYLEAVEKLFMRNLLIKGELEVLGRTIRLQTISCPVAMLAGEKDDITLVPQLFNMKNYISTPKENIYRSVVKGAGHISVFMGRNALTDNWPEALKFLNERLAGPQAECLIWENDSQCLAPVGE